MRPPSRLWGFRAPRRPCFDHRMPNLPPSISPTPDASWRISEQGFVAAREHEVETVMSIANGYLGTRAALAEGSLLSDPATYLANVYVSSTAGQPVLARAPQWLPLQGAVDGRAFSLQTGTRERHCRFLDMRQGLLWRDWVSVDDGGRRTRILGYRLASLANLHWVLQVVYFTPENYAGALRLESGIGGAPGYATVFWKHEAEGVLITGATADLGRGRQVFAAGRSAFGALGEPMQGPAVEIGSHGAFARWQGEVEIGKTYRLDRFLAVYTTAWDAQAMEQARRDAVAFSPGETDRMVREHIACWREEWACADVEVAGDEEAQRALRFAAFQMRGAVSPQFSQTAVGPRGLSGGGYGGHVFWDADIYVFPFLLYTSPEAARGLLGYRYATLPAARAKAEKAGYRGAWYAWESADTGEETTPQWILTPDGQAARVYCGDQEIHISADVAYAVWQYWLATQDLAYLAAQGAEILVETARFWASRVAEEKDGRFHLRGVMGPDEFHPSIGDNAYTNAMAAANLEYAAAALELLDENAAADAQALRTRISLGEGEPGRWRGIARRMFAGRTSRDGVLEQFDGFFALKDEGPVSRERALLMQTEALREFQIVKQADVVMLLALHPQAFAREQRRANFAYYEPRTWHASSLSPGIHALVAAGFGDVSAAKTYFDQAALIDLAMQGNAANGVHLAALGSLWMTVVFGFAGVQFNENSVAVRPRLPARWQRLAFHLRYRGRLLSVVCTPEDAQVIVLEGPPLDIERREAAQARPAAAAPPP